MKFNAICDEDGLESLSDEILSLTGSIKYILLYGDLGAGKTTLVRHIACAAGIPDIISSPTFSIHNTYEGRIKILHSDLYRIESVSELEQTGFFELLDAADLALIEWPDKVPLKDMLERYIEIHILSLGDKRSYTVISSEGIGE